MFGLPFGLSGCRGVLGLAWGPPGFGVSFFIIVEMGFWGKGKCFPVGLVLLCSVASFGGVRTAYLSPLAKARLVEGTTLSCLRRGTFFASAKKVTKKTDLGLCPKNPLNVEIVLFFGTFTILSRSQGKQCASIPKGYEVEALACW